MPNETRSKCQSEGVNPKRVQRKRTKGWRMPENAVYVGRPSRWGNPLKIGITVKHLHVPIYETVKNKEDILRLYKIHAEYACDEVEGWIDPLKGKDLACWCPLDQPCHADVLLRLANE